MLEVILFFFIVVAGTGGELCVSSAMKSIGEVHDFRPRSLLNFVLQSLRLPWMWMGIVLMARDAVPLAELAHGVLARVVLHYKAKLFFHNTARFPCHALCSTSTCHSLSVSGMLPVCTAGPSPLPYLCPQAAENKRAMIYEKLKSVKGKRLEEASGQEYQSKEVRCRESTFGF